MSLKVKTTLGDTTGSEIPQELGNIKVKDQNGIMQFVNTIYRKNAVDTNTTEIVWQLGTESSSTNITTNDTPVACGNCPPTELRYFPLNWPPTGTSEERWNCPVWKNTSKIVDQQAAYNGLVPIVFDDPEIFTTFLRRYARATIMHPNSIQYFLPPPPNHIVMDYATGPVADSIMVLDNSAYALIPNEVQGLLTVPSGNPFETLLSAKYRVKCTSYPTSMVSVGNFVCNFISDPDPPILVPGERFPCSCSAGGVLCNPDAPGPFQKGGACSSIEDMIGDGNYLNLLTYTNCVYTGGEHQCNTVCYSNPSLVADDATLNCTIPCIPIRPYQRYHCREVGYLPNVLIGEQTQLDEFGTDLTETVRVSMFDAAYSFAEISILAESGCNPLDDCVDPEGDFPHCPLSSWSARIFLPFYLNVPSNIVTGPNIAALFGKHIQFFKGLPADLAGTRYPLLLNDTAIEDHYSNHPPLSQMYHLIRGNIRAACIVMGNGYNPFEQPPVDVNTLVWGAVGYPHYINGVPSHTHQVVLEMGTTIEGPDGPDDGQGCSECWFVDPPIFGSGGGGPGGPGQGLPSLDISRFRLYPITNDTGTAYLPTFDNLIRRSRTFGNNTGADITKGIGNVDIIKKDISDEGTLGEILLGSVYVDQFDGKNIIKDDTAPISCGNLLLTLQQPPIPSDTAYDCACNVVGL